jgi:hypothetical protein
MFNFTIRLLYHCRKNPGGWVDITASRDAFEARIPPSLKKIKPYFSAVKLDVYSLY